MAILGKNLSKQDEEKRLEVLNQGMMSLIRKVHGLVENTDIEKYRQSQDHIGAAFGYSKDMNIEEVLIGTIMGEWVSVVRAHMKKYVILYCHGGGYSTGSSIYARTLTTKLAESTFMNVLSFDYRLAPEHPYPAALEDAMEAWNYLMLLGYGARDVIVAGDSAGGNLSLSLVLRLKAEGRLLPRGIILMSPWTDLTSSGESHETRAELDPVLSETYIKTMIENYAKGQDLTDPSISPLFGDFKGFPPTLIQVGDNEILLDDSIALYRKLLEDNVPAKLDIQKGMWHVYQMSPFKPAYEAMERNAEFIFEVCR